MRLAAFGEPLVAEGYEDGEKWLRENLMDVVHEEALQGPRAFGKNGACGVGELEVFRDSIDSREYDGLALGCAWVDDDWEAVDRPAV